MRLRTLHLHLHDAQVQEQALLTVTRLVQGLLCSAAQLLDPALQPLQGAERATSTAGVWG
jgi:hypothetical protein